MMIPRTTRNGQNRPLQGAVSQGSQREANPSLPPQPPRTGQFQGQQGMTFSQQQNNRRTTVGAQQQQNQQKTNKKQQQLPPLMNYNNNNKNKQMPPLINNSNK
jgi:hypothetical protein